MNQRVMNLCLLLACVVTMLLGIQIALEDHEVWGVLQFVAFAVFNGFLGACIILTASSLIKE